MKWGIGVCVVALGALALSACTPKPPACSEPIPPKTVDGSTATESQMLEARDVVQRFIKQSDGYQDCLNAALKEHDKNPSWLSRYYDDGFRADIVRRKLANQKVKEKVGNGFNQ